MTTFYRLNEKGETEPCNENEGIITKSHGVSNRWVNIENNRIGRYFVYTSFIGRGGPPSSNPILFESGISDSKKRNGYMVIKRICRNMKEAYVAHLLSLLQVRKLLLKKKDHKLVEKTDRIIKILYEKVPGLSNRQKWKGVKIITHYCF